MNVGDTVEYYSAVLWDERLDSYYMETSTGVIRVLRDEVVEIETDGITREIHREDIVTLPK